MTRFLICFSIIATLYPASLPADGGGIDLSYRMRIVTEADFREHVVDRRAVGRNGDWNLSRSNGRLQGIYGGRQFKGMWRWSNVNWCRKGTLGGAMVDDCWRLEIDGRKLRIAPAKGGNTYTYRLN
ncbi:hypothetical protein [Aquicoccus porphyridii]|uniref:hypothetical protein n=1 Tax=Aquicoccus porphyridii TaxID=1852029 RepID=UPI00273DEE64|nr:hypothetical protein [Aquicoccus porphyridii]